MCHILTHTLTGVLDELPTYFKFIYLRGTLEKKKYFKRTAIAFVIINGLDFPDRAGNPSRISSFLPVSRHVSICYERVYGVMLKSKYQILTSLLFFTFQLVLHNIVPLAIFYGQQHVINSLNVTATRHACMHPHSDSYLLPTVLTTLL